MAFFGGFDNSRGKQGQSYPGSLQELNEKLKELADATPGAKQTELPGGGTSTEFSDGTKVDTYPGRTKSGTNLPGFSVTKDGQKQRNGIKGTVEGGKTKAPSGKSSDKKNEKEKNGGEKKTKKGNAQ